VGDELLFRDGRIEPIDQLRLYTFFATVYNFEVEDLHCYAVGRSGILVHNNNGPEAVPGSVAPNTGRAVPKTGDLFERTFQTPKGPVDLLAETVVEGDTLILNDVAVYGRSPSNLTGLTKEALAARTELIEEAKALGFKKLRITAQRVPNSSSGNPGHAIDITVDLTK
jgi:hypothetical protein